MLSPVFTEYQGKRFIFFSSPHSDNGCLSNWYESPFSLDSHDFESAEQAFLYFKAMSSGDEATALRVFAMDEPRYFARLNHQIRPFDARRWAEEREGRMRSIVHEKFSQSEELTAFLLATGDATIVNCSKNPLWSCGLQMTQTERLDQGTWLGQNLLGTMLMELREELRPAEPEPEPEAAPEPAGTTPEQKAPTKTEPEPLEEAEPASSAAADAPAVTSAEAAPDETDAHTSEHASAGDGATTDNPTSGQASPDETTTLPTTAAADSEGPSQPKEAVSAGDGSASTAAEEQDGSTAQPQAQSPAPAVSPTDAEETELMPSAESFDKTTVIPNLDQTRLAPEPAAAPQQEGGKTTADVLITRYSQGDYPTADELADGSVLKCLIKSFTQENSTAVRQALMQCLRDSVVAVPATKVDPLVASTAPVRDDGLSDPLIMDGGKTYRPSILENEAGQRWFPAFSNVTEISSELSGRTSVIMLPMAQCVELARTHGGLAGIVVNVFTENLILPGRTCDYIAGLPSHTA